MSEDSIFREVDEELRSERMHALWRRFGPIVIGAAVAVVVLVGANEGWRWYKDTNSARSSDLLYAAFTSAEAGDTVAAQEALNVTIEQGSGQYPLLAQFRQAALLLEDGKTQEAVAAYDALSTTAEDKRLRELAFVLAAQALVDSGDVAGIEARVGGILSSEGALQGTAREALGLAQYKAGDLAAALETFELIIADPSTVSNQIGRIQIYIAQLAAEGISSADDSGEVVAVEN